jgi:hypothetical protein
MIPFKIREFLIRRLLLLLSAFATLTWAQDVRAPRPEEPPPITVKVEPPPESVGATVMKLAIPTILGAGLTLFGVWLTNKRNAAENEANRKHQFEVNSRQKRWEFRKDVYTKLLACLTGMMQNSLERSRLLNCRTHIDEKDKARLNSISADLDSNNDSYLVLLTEYYALFYLSTVATADTLLKEDAVATAFTDHDSNTVVGVKKRLDALHRLVQSVSNAARQDLWGDGYYDDDTETKGIPEVGG